MNNKLFEFNQAAPNRYIAHFYRECTVAEFLKIILETKPEDYGCIVIFDSKDYPLDSYHYKNGKIFIILQMKKPMKRQSTLLLEMEAGLQWTIH